MDTDVNTTSTHFFDSWGNLWATCAAEAPGAEAFGPAYTARRADPVAAGLNVRPGETAYAAAARVGRVLRAAECHEWDLLDTSPTLDDLPTRERAALLEEYAGDEVAADAIRMK